MTQDKKADEKNRILIAFPGKSVSKAKRMFAGKGEIRWLYFGQDFIAIGFSIVMKVEFPHPKFIIPDRKTTGSPNILLETIP